MKDLNELFIKYQCVKSVLHAKLYNELFIPYSEKEINFLEIGIYTGGSMLAWKEALPKAKLFGIDINVPVDLDLSFCEVFLGDQSYKPFMDIVASKIKELDIVVDDGGHWSDDQQVSFESLWPIVKPNGIYIIEDLWVARKWNTKGFKCTIDYLKELDIEKKFYPGFYDFQEDICVLYKK